MCCLSSLGPSPRHDNLRDFFAVGVYRLFFPSVLTASNTGTHRRQITDLLDQSIQVHSQCFVITSDNRYILLCGFWDKSFRVYSTDTGNRIASLSVNPSLQQVAVGGLKGFLISPVKPSLLSNSTEFRAHPPEQWERRHCFQLVKYKLMQ